MQAQALYKLYVMTYWFDFMSSLFLLCHQLKKSLMINISYRLLEEENKLLQNKIALLSKELNVLKSLFASSGVNSTTRASLN